MIKACQFNSTPLILCLVEPVTQLLDHESRFCCDVGQLLKTDVGVKVAVAASYRLVVIDL